ncbi:MAG: hypothetical protein AAFP69_16010 [Planctomycetota bacterium]
MQSFAMHRHEVPGSHSMLWNAAKPSRQFLLLLTGMLACIATASTNACAEEIFLSVGLQGRRMVSRDGATWTDHTQWPGSKDRLTCAVTFKGAFYAGGGYSEPRITATSDGKTWSRGSLPQGGGSLIGLEVIQGALYAVTTRNSDPSSLR